MKLLKMNSSFKQSMLVDGHIPPYYVLDSIHVTARKLIINVSRSHVVVKEKCLC